MFPQVSKSRMYTMIDGKKGNIVVEMNHISKTRATMAILDLNWETGASQCWCNPTSRTVNRPPHSTP